MFGVPRLGFASRSLPLARTSHRLAILFVYKLTKYRSGVLVSFSNETVHSKITRLNKKTPKLGVFCIVGVPRLELGTSRLRPMGYGRAGTHQM